MEQYTPPVMEIIMFDDVDVVTTSCMGYAPNGSSDTHLPEIPIQH